MSEASTGCISIVGARQHNLKDVSVDIPKNSLVVITGPSGSGKSSLAFDTLYAEGQRRYVDSLSSYARQFIEQHDKPDVDHITGLSPAISINQKTTSRNPRSTLATITEIYDYLRLMFARIGIVYSPASGLPLKSYSASEIISILSQLPNGTKLRLCAPIVTQQKGEHGDKIKQIKQQGYSRLKIDGKLAEADNPPKLDIKVAHSIEVITDRIVISHNLGNRLADSVQNCLLLGDGTINCDIVALPEDIDEFQLPNQAVRTGSSFCFSEKLACQLSGFSLEKVEPRIFSFNSPLGSCSTCNGLGTELQCHTDFIIPDPSISLLEGAIKPWYRKNHHHYLQVLDSLAKHYKFSLHTPFAELDENIKNIILNGSGKEKIEFTFDDDRRKHSVSKVFEGVIEDLNQTKTPYDGYDIDHDNPEEEWKVITACRTCNGFRLKKESLCVKIRDMHIGEICRMTVEEAAKWFTELPDHLTNTQRQITDLVIKEILSRLKFLTDVGLNYLSLNRDASTFSGGEAQRIRLASQIGSGLCGIIYVLDEPSIGLHQSDNHKLINTLYRLRDLGNSVVVVEHDEDTMMAADHIIDVGPNAGEDGGNIVAQGTIEQILEHPTSITGAFLSGRDGVYLPRARRKYGKGQFIEVQNARAHNLKNIDVKIPLGTFTVVSGISGGGKSTLVIDTIYQALSHHINKSRTKPGEHDALLGIDNVDQVIKIDQSPIGRTPRSNPATYTATFSQIRDLFIALPESRARGYKLGRFSFNVKGGRCENCQGCGVIRIDMQFLSDVYITCDVCKGTRYNKETLEIQYKGKSISDVLNMTVREALGFFKNIQSIYEKIKALDSVGLGYMKIGQPATTLSGGEAQRIKLAKELAKRATGNTLYVLDEPTTGLHSCDIKKLLDVLHSLVDYGNSMLIIEHNLDVIKTADYVIDIGPKGGAEGGYVLATGTPEEVADNPNSITGPYLKKVLDRSRKMGHVME